MPPIDPSRNFEEVLTLLQSSQMTTLQQLFQLGDKLWLGLTADCDSRVILAIARHADIDIKPFTRVAAQMSVADRLLSPKLAWVCGYQHRLRWGCKPHPERRQLVAEHSAGHVSDGDGEPFVQGVRDALNSIRLGGHSFEVASGFGSPRQLPETVDDPEAAVQQIAQLFHEPLNSTAIVGIREWLKWVLHTPHPHLDWRDRFYIEQRLSALHQIELIHRTVPQLLQHPFNPPTSILGHSEWLPLSRPLTPVRYRKVTNKLERLWHSLALHG